MERLLFIMSLLLVACGQGDPSVVDALNDCAYEWHYRSLDSTEHYARKAFEASANYVDGRAEALNNLAFVSLVRMDYERAKRQLDSIPATTDNQLELLVSYVQQMRLCQRRSSNREFYDYREKAQRAVMRLHEDPDALNDRQWRRLIYAESEMAIVTSTYYYYVGLERQAADAILSISSGVEQDTAQFLNYLYNVGAGGTITTGTQQTINQQEFDHLMRCFLLSQQSGMAYFAANSLEGLAEHLINDDYRRQLIDDNLPAMKFINPDGVPDDMLPLWLADNALATFREYGDTYQIAGAYRTLASCYLAQGDYESALFNLEQALSDSAINQAPDLVASIREQLSVAYAAIDDKAESDRNRNIYLDLQEQTRQDRSLEARAGQLEQALAQTEHLLWAVVAAIAVLIAVLLFYYHRRKRQMAQPDTALQEREDELHEQLAVMRLRVEKGERRHLEQRAKVSLVNGITPFIDRILYTIDHSPLIIDHSEAQKEASANVQCSMFNVQCSYVLELTDEIERQNQLLTHWIQLRQGELSLHIETFDLQPLFDLLQKSASSFAMKGITLQVVPTTARVKADRVLTLFMLNTLADNARKFTPEGGIVSVSATEQDSYVEVSVSDTGCGMDEEQLAHVFDRKVIVDEKLPTDRGQVSHGFGLLNCKGIIEKYRKLSTIFSVCQLSAESKVGEGSRFFFRLPRGVVKVLLLIALIIPIAPISLMAEEPLHRAAIFADSAYFSNINGTYERTLLFADSCRQYLNDHYRRQYPLATDTLLMLGDLSTTPPEIVWLHDSIKTNYQLLLYLRNESAVAALALQEWTLYQYNNRIYTQLFKELSADSTLDDYCRKMQQSQSNRQVAIILLVLIFIVILLAVAWQLMQSLNVSARRQQEFQNHLDMLGDELQRLTMEENALHVSNAVLDNTLSTLKHETMYYPSRIRQMIDGSDFRPQTSDHRLQTSDIREVAAYYRELYGLLSAQSMSQVERVKLHLKSLDHGILGDENLIRYLFEILKKENGGQPLTVDYSVRDEKYVECRVAMPSLTRTDLFTPSQVGNIPFLLCRQIVRDHGEATNRRACAITSTIADKGITIIITLPKAKLSNRKS